MSNSLLAIGIHYEKELLPRKFSCEHSFSILTAKVFPFECFALYRKQQKFCDTKLSRFTGFYQNVGKTFTFLLQLYPRMFAYQRAAIVFERISHVN